MHDKQSIWIKTSLVEESITTSKSKLILARSARRLNDDRFLEDEEEDNDWGWIKGEIINERENDKEADDDNDGSNSNNGILTILIKDEESIYNGYELTNISSNELQNNNILVANIHKDDENDNSNFNYSSSSLESEEEELSYPSDLTNLIHLHEPAILHVLRKRYEYDEIYTTASDTILVALNPFKHYNDLYSIKTMKEYYYQGCSNSNNNNSSSKSSDNDNIDLGLLPPHVFSIADNAYRTMNDKLNDMSSPLSTSTSSDNTNTINISCADQSILVSGESGAGKTVSTKYIMKYLATLSHFEDNHNNNDCGSGNSKKVSSSSSHNKNQVEQQVLQSNPILESFGNARTVRNDNSSRFGKFIEIQFTTSPSSSSSSTSNSTTQILGANIETYLLEKVRLITQSYNERNFHIFYEILSGFTTEQRVLYYLEDFECMDFNMLLSESDTYNRRDGIDDCDTYDELIHALESIMMNNDNENDDIINNIFTVTCLCLHLSNIEIVPNTNNNNEDGSKILYDEDGENNIHLNAVLSLLGVSYEQLNEAICYFSIVAGKEHHKRCMNVNRAQRAIHGLIKACYGSLFTFLVQRINSSFIVSSSTQTSVPVPTTPTSTPRQQQSRNRSISSKSKSSSKNTAFIGILDIFGFESFQINSFEQLCINYCNEALQNQFNTFIFQQEQQLYNVEGISWDFITFPDNKDVLTLLDSKLCNTASKEHGLFQILDDQCRAPGTSDKSFSTEIYRKLQIKSKAKEKQKQIFIADHRQVGLNKFSIQHYAGIVEYDILSGFVEKNKDEVPKETTELLDCSNNKFYSILSTILKNGNSNAGGGNKISSPKANLYRKSSSTNLSSPTSSSKSLSSSSRTLITTGYQFRTQLQNLLSKIQVTTPHYIRCIKPNDTLTPDNFDCKRIVDQLRCAGVVEAIRISRSGYPHRYNHNVFLNSFKILALKELELCNNKKSKSKNSPMISSKKRNGRSLTSSSSSLRPLDILVTTIRKHMIESSCNAEKKEIMNNSIQVGKTKVFCNTIAYEYIERKRKILFITSTIKIQSNIRRYLCVQSYKALLRQIALENKSAIIIQKYWKMYCACDLYYKKVLYVILFIQRIYRGNKQRKLFHELLLVSRAIQLQSYIRMLLYSKAFKKQKSSSIIIQCAYRCYQSRLMLHKLKTDAKDFQKVYNERNVLQQEKLTLLNELKEARELLHAMQQQKQQQSEEEKVSEPQSKTNQLQKQLSGINQVENEEEMIISTNKQKEELKKKRNKNNGNNSITSCSSSTVNSKAEQDKIITYCTNILSQQLLTTVVQENEQLHVEINSKQKLYNDYIKIKEDAKKLKDNLENSKKNQEKLQNEILVLMQERESKNKNIDNIQSNDDNIENVEDNSPITNESNKEDKTAMTIAALQEEIKKLKERDAINTLQLDKLSRNHNNNHNNAHNIPNIPIDSDDSDDDSCESYEERIIAANAIYNSDGSSASSRFFLEKEPFIPPDIYLPAQTSTENNDNADNGTMSTPTDGGGSKKYMFVNKFNNDELSQYDDLSLGFNSNVFISPPTTKDDYDNTNNNNRSRCYSDTIRPNNQNNQNKLSSSSSHYNTSDYNNLQQTTRYSDLRKESTNSCNILPIISSTGAISDSSETGGTSTASCITALTTQLDLANNKILNLKTKLKYYKKKDKKHDNGSISYNHDSSSSDDDSDNYFTKQSSSPQELLSHTASSTTSENSNNSINNNDMNDDEDSVIKSDVPRNIEVDVSSKCERLEQQIAHLERRLDNMSLVSSRTGRHSRGGNTSRYSSSHSNNSIFDDDDILSYRERATATMSATRSTVAVDDISFSVPSSINNEQVIHHLLSDNDFIRNAVKNHMDEYARNNNINLNNVSFENNHQDHINGNERSNNNNNNRRGGNEKSNVTYPAVDCRLGRFFRSFVRSNGGPTGPSSGQSAYSSAYMR